jgi:hypothetical protein
VSLLSESTAETLRAEGDRISGVEAEVSQSRLCRLVARPGRFSRGGSGGGRSEALTVEATDTETGRIVALKKVPFQGGEAQFAAFRALEILAEDTHPALLRLVAFRVEEADLLVATEFHSNGSLEAALRRERNGGGSVFDATRKSKIIFGVVAGMASLHARGVLHRGLNPGNIFLNHAFEPVIGGMKTDITDTVPPIGSVRFMAPELFDGDDAGCDFRVDVYAFAVTLYSLFAEPKELDDGRPTRNAQSLVKRVKGGARFVRKPEIPDFHWSLIVGCWHQSQSSRPEFFALLDAFRSEHKYILAGADRTAVLEYEAKAYSRFGRPKGTAEEVRQWQFTSEADAARLRAGVLAARNAQTELATEVSVTGLSFDLSQLKTGFWL